MSAPAITAATPEAARFLQIFGVEHRTTMNVLQALPADKLDFKPHERHWTAAQLAWHIATSQYVVARIVAAGRFEMEPQTPAPASLQEIVDGAENCYQKACETLGALTAEQLAARIPLPGGRSMSASSLMWSGVLFHQIHHRGQLSIYIRLMGGKVPSIYGPSADENPFA